MSPVETGTAQKVQPGTKRTQNTQLMMLDFCKRNAAAGNGFREDSRCCDLFAFLMSEFVWRRRGGDQACLLNALAVGEIMASSA